MSVSNVDRLDVNGSITFSDHTKMFGLNPFALGNLARFQAGLNAYGKDVLAFDVFNPTRGVYETFFEVSGDDAFDPIDGDYRLTYLEIARDMRDPPDVDWTVANVTPSRASLLKAGTPPLFTLTESVRNSLVAKTVADVNAIIAAADTQRLAAYDSENPVFPSWAFDSTGYNDRRLRVDRYARMPLQDERLIIVPATNTPAILPGEFAVRIKFWNPTLGRGPNSISISIKHNGALDFFMIGAGSSYPTSPQTSVYSSGTTTTVTVSHPFAFDANWAYGLIDIGIVRWMNTTGEAFSAPSSPIWSTSSVTQVTGYAPYTMSTPEAVVVANEDVDLLELMHGYALCSINLQQIPINYVFK
eukprot:jgi/Mesvir1/10262/Mv13867-RA.1